MRFSLAMLLFTAGLMAADPAVIERGRAEERRSCVGCHGPRITHSQRLSRAVWDREIAKMEGWGAAIKDRTALLEYLTSVFGEDKPVPAPVLSGDGTRK